MICIALAAQSRQSYSVTNVRPCQEARLRKLLLGVRRENHHREICACRGSECDADSEVAKMLTSRMLRSLSMRLGRNIRSIVISIAFVVRLI